LRFQWVKDKFDTHRYSKLHVRNISRTIDEAHNEFLLHLSESKQLYKMTYTVNKLDIIRHSTISLLNCFTFIALSSEIKILNKWVIHAFRTYYSLNKIYTDKFKYTTVKYIIIYLWGVCRWTETVINNYLWEIHFNIVLILQLSLSSI